MKLKTSVLSFVRNLGTAAVFVCILLTLSTPSFPETSSLEGTILDAAGQPVPNASIRVNPVGTQTTLKVVSNSAGRFLIHGVSPGTWLIEVSSKLQPPTATTVEIPESGSLENVEIRLGSQHVERVVVTGVVGGDMKDVPGGTAVVTSEEIAHSLGHNLKDVLAFVPGVVAQPRFGADESQVSIRGSGLRNNFHNRGTNLLINGIPYQDADGFGDFESLDLLATERIEVWKGANALRYGGNTAGGAINFVTEDGLTGAPWKLLGEGGSWGLLKAQVATADDSHAVPYYLSASRTSLDGYREHSEQLRERFFGNLQWSAGPETRMMADLSYAHVDEDLPGSLNRAEFDDDPRQAGSEQVNQDWGRRYHFGRGALGVFHRLSDHQELGGSIYGQIRDMVHPIFQVLDQRQRTLGGEIHYRFDGRPEGWLRGFTVGIAPQYGTTNERRFENNEGQSGELAASFRTTAQNYGMYAEARIGMAPNTVLSIGGRWDRAVRRFDDRFDDGSDRRTFGAITPRVGLLWDPGKDLQFFANASRSYEPPLLLELTSFGAPGFLDLDAQDTWQYEIGSRGRWKERLRWDISAFHWRVRDEIININVQPFPFAPFTVPSYRNADRTRHSGIELGLEATLVRESSNGSRVDARVAYTVSRFRFDSDPVYANNDLPGAPRGLLRGEIRVQPTRRLWLAPNVDGSPSSYFVDSANTTKNDAYRVVGLKGGYDWKQAGIFFEAANLTDEHYSASVQVDDALGRFFEPSNGRSFYMGVRWNPRGGAR